MVAALRVGQLTHVQHMLVSRVLSKIKDVIKLLT